MDVVAVSEAVALMAATGAISGLGESAALGVVGRIRERMRGVFTSDARSVDALERAVADPSDGRVQELAAALAWYARRDEEFADELAGWAREYAAGGVGGAERAGGPGRLHRGPGHDGEPAARHRGVVRWRPHLMPARRAICRCARTRTRAGTPTPLVVP